jgi:methylated-DNA-[protein]-cysteine S-methyltransferase
MQKSEQDVSNFVLKVDSPVGGLMLVQTLSQQGEESICGVVFEKNWPKFLERWPGSKYDSTAFLKEVSRQLDLYFSGDLVAFKVPLLPEGTSFQKQAWRALSQIPYGTTSNYKTQAEVIGRPKAVRAIGTANGQNPISILIPCHRVIASTGRLAGYGGGLKTKSYLLDLEQRTAEKSKPSF